jgi:hypothetical protein
VNVGLTDRLRAALRLADDAEVLDHEGTLTVRVDWVERRYRDAIKSGAVPVEAPRDEVGLGAWRRIARVRDGAAGPVVTMWSDRG